MSGRNRVSAALFGLLALVVAVWFGQDVLAGGASAPERTAAVAGSTSTATPLSDLPPEAGEVWQLIEEDGPFPHEQDGATFGNREGLLPDRDRDYYREYTVRTPGEDDRGARRLVTGTGGELYYTADHYDSFVAVDPGR